MQGTHQGFLARSIPARRRHGLLCRPYSAIKKRHASACLFFMAEWVGFEPTVPLPVHLISSQGRYNHFDTTPYELALVLYQQARAKSRVFLRKPRECFLRRGNASCFCCKRGVHRRRTFCGKMSEISVANSHFRCYSRQAPRAYAARILKLGAWLPCGTICVT